MSLPHARLMPPRIARRASRGTDKMRRIIRCVEIAKANLFMQNRRAGAYEAGVIFIDWR